MNQIRLVTESDAAALLEIYAPYVSGTSITFETEVPDAASFGKRISHYLDFCPWLVSESDGVITGYAYASRYRERVAYQWSVECSVYIHPSFMRYGLASALYKTLFDILRVQGFRNVYAVINLPNERSVALHERLGFRYFATYEKVGYKLGQWKNVGWWQLVLNSFDEEPAAPVPFKELNKEFLEELFVRNGRKMG
jgi:L-amino acid N-acyltransferase YncA